MPEWRWHDVDVDPKSNSNKQYEAEKFFHILYLPTAEIEMK